jgi:putative ABC transport system ATP-binding protein
VRCEFATRRTRNQANFPTECAGSGSAQAISPSNGLLNLARHVSVSTVSDSTIVRAENLGRSVKGKVLVQDVNFDVRAGEVLAIAGPSGSGKTSLLRLLNRLDEPTAGTVFVQGMDYREIEPRELRRKLGMVMQRPYLFPGTVEENLRFGPAQRGLTLAQDAMEDLLARVGLQGYAARNVANLSGGEAQRVSVARTLANSPLVLLLDEPTSALDEVAKLEVESLIQNIVRDQRLTCVIVTHDLAQAARVAGRALLFEAGRVTRIGSVREVLHA